MTYRRTLLLFLLIFFIYFMVAMEVRAEELQPELTGINVRGVGSFTEIQIESNSLLSYTIYKPADPYRVVVELQGIVPGKFKDKIVIDRAGVAEIIPSKVEGDVKITRLEIILTVPAEIKPQQKEKALILAFYNPEAEEVAAAAPKEELPVVEEPKLLAKEEEKHEEAVLKEAKIIKDIELIKSADKVNVLISGDGKMSPKVFEVDKNKIVVDIPQVSTTIEPKIYEPPLLGIRVGRHPDRTRIVFDLAGPTKYDVSAEGNQIMVSFEKPKVEVAEVITPSRKEEVPEVTKLKVEPFTTSEYVGEKISLDFQDADLLHIFRLLADVSGYNIVVSPQVKGKFSMKLINVPWDQALDTILRNYGLSKAVESNIIRIAPTAVLAQEEEEIAKAKEAKEKAGDLETRVYPINYADVSKVKKVIEDAKVITKRGYISVDERTSSVIIKDVAHMHKEFERLIKSIDSPTPQVNIEAKIVEVTTNFTKELGIQWGVLMRPTPQTEIGGTGATEGSGFFSTEPLVVNLPAAVASGSGGAIGFGYLSAKDLRALDIQLSAMESSGKGKIVSNPKIITMDNQKATIQQGKKIPYQTVSAEGTKTEFVDANLELTVTPHITPEETIVMELVTKKNEADFSQTVGGVPTIDTKEAKTQVLIKDGDTLVIGGIFKTNVSKSVAGVPGLSKIPILGWLFKKEKDVDDTTELLIFITPRIVR